MRIGIYQRSLHHTEIIAGFIEPIKIIYPEAEIVVFYDQEDYSCFLPYFSRFLDFEVKKCSQLCILEFDWLIFSTAFNVGDVKELNDKFILTSHTDEFTNKYDCSNVKHITVSPLVKLRYPHQCILPVYSFDDVLYEHNNRYLLVGNLGPDRDIDTLEKLLDDGIDLDIVCHSKFAFDIQFRLEKYKVDYYFDLNVVELINMLKRSKYVLPLTKGQYHTRKLTGILPLSLSNNVPMILHKDLVEIYGLSGCCGEGERFGLVGSIIKKKREIVAQNVQKFLTIFGLQ